jgi:hypothetical protein
MPDWLLAVLATIAGVAIGGLLIQVSQLWLAAVDLICDWIAAIGRQS